MFTEKNQAYVDEFINAFMDQYELNDPAHRLQHFEEVLEVGLELREAFELYKYSVDMLIAGAYLHDLFARYRDIHHILAEEFVKNSDHSVLSRFTTHERNILAKGCGEHRSSYKGAYSSEFSELLSSADCGRVTDGDNLLTRSIEYHRYHFGISTSEAEKEAKKHMKEKFGEDGYARYPTMYKRYYSEALKRRNKVIALW